MKIRGWGYRFCPLMTGSHLWGMEGSAGVWLGRLQGQSHPQSCCAVTTPEIQTFYGIWILGILVGVLSP